MNALHPLLSCLVSYPNPPNPLNYLIRLLITLRVVMRSISGFKKGFATILDIEILNFFAGPT